VGSLSALLFLQLVNLAVYSSYKTTSGASWRVDSVMLFFEWGFPWFLFRKIRFSSFSFLVLVYKDNVFQKEERKKKKNVIFLNKNQERERRKTLSF
jgi:hypothetical protein